MTVAVAVMLVVQVGAERDVGAFVHSAEELDEPRRLMHREREEDGVEQADGGGVCANAERSEAGFAEELEGRSGCPGEVLPCLLQDTRGCAEEPRRCAGSASRLRR